MGTAETIHTKEYFVEYRRELNALELRPAKYIPSLSGLSKELRGRTEVQTMMKRG